MQNLKGERDTNVWVALDIQSFGLSASIGGRKGSLPLLQFSAEIRGRDGSSGHFAWQVYL